MAVYLEEFVESIDNLPAEIKHFLAEIRTRDENAAELKKQIHSSEKTYWNIVKEQSLPAPTGQPQPQPLAPKSKDVADSSATTPMDVDMPPPVPDPLPASLDALELKLGEKYTRARQLTKEKITLAEKAIDLMNKHIRKLDESIALASSNVDENVLVSHLFDTAQFDKSSAMARKGSDWSRRKKAQRPPSMVRADGNDFTEDEEGFDEDGVEPVYCICQQVSYGEMIACDNDKCPFHWFHLQCVGLTTIPSAPQWFCPICSKKNGH